MVLTMSDFRRFLSLFCMACVLSFQSADGLAFDSGLSRKRFFRSIGAAGVAQLVAPPMGAAAETLDLSDDQLKAIIKSDILDRQFLATGNISREIYLPTATFTDEIDTYGLDQWTKGTQKLFVGEKSSVRLLGDIDVTKKKIEFRFDEDLMFRIPFRPTVSLSGTVILERDPSGYISSYREFWDHDVVTVLKTAKF